MVVSLHGSIAEQVHASNAHNGTIAPPVGRVPDSPQFRDIKMRYLLIQDYGYYQTVPLPLSPSIQAKLHLSACLFWVTMVTRVLPLVIVL